MELHQAVLIGILAMFAKAMGDIGGGIMFDRPIVLAPLVGLIMGDLQQGLIIGAALELIFLGVVSIGGSTPSDSNMGSILGTAFAMSMGQGVEIALTLAVPIGLLAQMMKYLVYFYRATTMHKVEEYAQDGNYNSITKLHFLHEAAYIALYGLITILALQFGANAMQSMVNRIPTVILDGLRIASNMLPAVGFALLMNMLWNKTLCVFLLFGFILTTYLNLPIIATACIALTIGVIMVTQDMSAAKSKKTAAVTAGANISDEEEFFNG